MKATESLKGSSSTDRPVVVADHRRSSTIPLRAIAPVPSPSHACIIVVERACRSSMLSRAAAAAAATAILPGAAAIIDAVPVRTRRPASW